MNKILKIENLVNEIKGLKNADATKNQLQIKSLEKSLFDLSDNSNTAKDVFVNALKYKCNKLNASEIDILIYNYMSESAGELGDLIVPDDIMTEVKDLRFDGTDLESLVNIEPVTTNKGKRIYEVRADNSPLPEVVEGDDIPEIDPSHLFDVGYNITGRKGIIKVPISILDDSTDALTNWLEIWIAKKSKATRNSMIINAINLTTSGKEISATIANLRNIILTSILDVYKSNSSILTNYAGYDFLDSLADINGNKFLEQDPTQPKVKLLFGLYPLKVIPDTLLPNGTGTIPLIVGDLKGAITLFDREKVTLNMAIFIDKNHQEIAAARLAERLDAETVDADAIIKINLSTTV